MKKCLRRFATTLLVAVTMAFSMQHVAAIQEPVEVTIKVAVTVAPENATKEDFTIVLAAEEETNPMPEDTQDGKSIIVISGQGEESFLPISYSHTGVYHYQIFQQQGTQQNWNYDDSVYHLTVYVTHGVDGDLEVSMVCHENEQSEKCDEIRFRNTYEKEVPPTETPDGPNTGDESNAFVWCALLGVGGAGCIALLLLKKRKA